ncbi:MAG: PRC-barrel domain-containing protein [Mycobacteriaceae bacterium]|nr:PRC-barrel domain-containing protein [Mycobacteriaceae bacterium]
MRLHQLLGLRVVDNNGRRVGRVADLTARSPGSDTVHVTGLLIGARAFLQRIGHDKWNLHPMHIAWQDIAGIDPKGVRLAISKEQIGRD